AIDLEPFPVTLAGFGHRAKELRLSQNLSQADVALRSGIGTATIHRFEKTGHISFENAFRLAIALGADAGFRRLFERPQYGSIDEVVARAAKPARQRARRRKS